MASSSRKLLKELPSEEKMSEIMVDLTAHGPQATVIMGAAYLEHALELLLRAKFIVLTKADDRRIFDGASGGILGSFSAKIRIAYAMQLLHENPYKALLIINDIRNVFAHSLHKVDFDHELVRKDCISLKKISPALTFSAGVTRSLLDDPQEIYSKIVQMLYFSFRRHLENNADDSAN